MAKWLYHDTEPPKLVDNDSDEAAARKAGFRDSPDPHALPSQPPESPSAAANKPPVDKQEYPKLLWHKSGSPVEVASPAEHDAKLHEGGYAESPAGPFSTAKGKPEKAEVVGGAEKK